MSLDCFLEGFIYLQDHHRIRNSNNLRYWNEKNRLKNLFLFTYACMYVFPYVHTWRLKEGTISPGAGLLTWVGESGEPTITQQEL